MKRDSRGGDVGGGCGSSDDGGSAGNNSTGRGDGSLVVAGMVVAVMVQDECVSRLAPLQNCLVDVAGSARCLSVTFAMILQAGSGLDAISIVVE